MLVYLCACRAQVFPDEGLGQAVMNRLEKAAGQHFIREPSAVAGAAAAAAETSVAGSH